MRRAIGGTAGASATTQDAATAGCESLRYAHPQTNTRAHTQLSQDLPCFLEAEIRRTQEDNTRLQKELGLVAVTRYHHRRFTYDAAAAPPAAAAAAAATRNDAWPRYQRSAGVSGGSSGAAGFEPYGHRRHSRAATPPPPASDATAPAPAPPQQRRSRTAHAAVDRRRVRAAPSEEERLPSLASRHSIAYVIPRPLSNAAHRTLHIHTALSTRQATRKAEDDSNRPANRATRAHRRSVLPSCDLRGRSRRGSVRWPWRRRTCACGSARWSWSTSAASSTRRAPASPFLPLLLLLPLPPPRCRPQPPLSRGPHQAQAQAAHRRRTRSARRR